MTLLVTAGAVGTVNGQKYANISIFSEWFCWKCFHAAYEIWAIIGFKAPVRVLLQAGNGKKVKPFPAYREPALGITMILKHEKTPKNFCVEWGNRHWRITQIEVSALASEGERVKTYQRHLLFTYGTDSLILLSVVRPMVNWIWGLKRESFCTKISNSAWYFWKALALCKKLFYLEKEAINT